ncbi:MAG: GNAT family N-acetyltransferase [Rhodococcus sp. (in: high G+C Gram-positive bacteria)]
MDQLLTIAATGLDDDDVVRMIDEVQQEYVRRYGGPDDTVLGAEQFTPPSGSFVKAMLDGNAVGMGGWRVHESGPHAEGLRAGDAEIKRMYVRSHARGRGVARAVLDSIERSAVDAGRRRLVLETGLRQPEAIGLYTSSGYTPLTPKFGVYRDEEQSLCMVKELDNRAAQR